MPTGLNMRVEITGDRTLFERAAKAFREPKRLMQKVAVLALSSAGGRLTQVLKQEGSIRTGRLAVSLAPGGDGNVFEISDFKLEVGTNLRYAAQVHYGGIIEPKNAKALAIPLTDDLKRAGIGPRELDPNRELLHFQPYKGSKPNIIGLLVANEPLVLKGSKAIRQGGKKAKRQGGALSGALYALASSVTQEARPFLYFSEQDLAEINGKLVPDWLAGK